MAKIIYIDDYEDTIENSSDNDTKIPEFSKEEENEINEIMNLFEDKTFSFKCDEFDREFEKDLSILSCGKNNKE